MPQYLLGLNFLTKATTILTVADDIYDSYGTIEELELLNEAVERLIGYFGTPCLAISYTFGHAGL